MFFFLGKIFRVFLLNLYYKFLYALFWKKILHTDRNTKLYNKTGIKNVNKFY